MAIDHSCEGKSTVFQVFDRRQKAYLFQSTIALYARTLAMCLVATEKSQALEKFQQWKERQSGKCMKRFDKVEPVQFTKRIMLYHVDNSPSKIFRSDDAASQQPMWSRVCRMLCIPASTTRNTPSVHSFYVNTVSMSKWYF